MNKTNKPDAIDSTLANLRSGGRASKTYATSNIDRLQQRIESLERQLKTAKPKLYRHVKTGGVYEFITGAQNESDMECVVVYKSVGNGIVWVRSNKEFYDGRFEEYANNLEGK